MGVAQVILERLAQAGIVHGSPVNAAHLADLMSHAVAASEGVGDWTLVQRLDGGDLLPSDIARWAMALLRSDQMAEVLWVPQRFAVTASTHAVLSRLDDLWYPGPDDLWMEGRDWGLLIDHNEIASFFNKD